MKTLVSAIIFAIFAAVGWAGANGNKPPPPPDVIEQNTDIDVGVKNKIDIENNNEASADANASADADASANASAEGGRGGDGGHANATGGSVGDVNAGGASVSINNKTHRQAAAAYAPTVFPSATCQGGYSAGVSTPAVGVSWGGSKNAREACLFALSQHYAALGMYEPACEALMATKAAEETYNGREKPSCKDQHGPMAREVASDKPQVVVVPMPIDLSRFVTKEELTEHEERIVETIMEK